MIDRTKVSHPVIHTLELDYFWLLGPSGLVAKGGEFYARREMGGRTADDFFTALEADCVADLHHTTSTAYLVGKKLKSVFDPQRRSLYTFNASMSGLTMDDAAEQILGCINLDQQCAPALEVREMRRPLSGQEMDKVEVSVRRLRQAGVRILLDDVDDTGEYDPRWSRLFQHASAIKLAEPVTQKIVKGGLGALSPATRQMIVDAAQDDRTVIAEAVEDIKGAHALCAHFSAFSHPLLQGRNLVGERRNNGPFSGVDVGVVRHPAIGV